MPQTPKRLAIHPYPEQYTRRPRLRDGTQATVRPIRPEDEPLWHELIASSSAESIRFRFRSIFRQTNHQMAVKYCTIDYERELRWWWNSARRTVAGCVTIVPHGLYLLVHRAT